MALRLFFLLPYLMSFAISIGIASYAIRRKHVVGAFALSVLTLSEASYIFGYIFELLSPDLPGKIFWDNFQFIGYLVFPAGLVLFALEYGRRIPGHRLYTLGLFALVPLATVILAYTDGLHHLMRADIQLVSAPPFGELTYSWTPIFLVTVVYFYVLVFTAIFILTRAISQLPSIFRAQTLTLLGGVLIVIVGSVFALLDIDIGGHRDTAPITFALCNLCIAWGAFRYHLLDLIPIAHNQIFEGMPDAVVVIDNQLRVIDMNPSAKVVLRGLNEGVVGKRVSEIVLDWAQIMHRLQTTSVKQDNVELILDGRRTYLDISLSPLITRNDDLLGYLIVARDVTSRKLAEDAEHEQRVFAEALIEVTKALNSTLNLDDLLECILENIEQVVPYKRAEISLVRDDELYIVGSRNIGVERPGLNLGSLGSLDNLPIVRMTEQTRKPFLLSDTADITTNPILANSHLARTTWVKSYLGAPIHAGERLVGFISLAHDTAGFYCKDHIPRVLAFAEQVAIAVENTRLYQLARTAAVAEERQRLARDIHDSVSQTLFASKSIAEMLLDEVSENAGKASDYAQQIIRLNKAATSELRTLMLELRPSALEQTDMGTLLRLLGDSFTGNTEILPHETQVVFYRVAQEAFNNISRYAHASRVTVDLRQEDGTNSMRIRDNGQGFDLAKVPSERLGIKLMHEHAESIGAQIEITSAVGAGTEVVLRIGSRT